MGNPRLRSTAPPKERKEKSQLQEKANIIVCTIAVFFLFLLEGVKLSLSTCYIPHTMLFMLHTCDDFILRAILQLCGLEKLSELQKD